MLVQVEEEMPLTTMRGMYLNAIKTRQMSQPCSSHKLLSDVCNVHFAHFSCLLEQDVVGDVCQDSVTRVLSDLRCAGR